MSAYLSLIGRRRGGRLLEVGRLLIFSPFRMGAYSKWALIRGWALVRINTVLTHGVPQARFARQSSAIKLRVWLKSRLNTPLGI